LRNDKGRPAVTELRKVFDDLVRFETMLWAAIDERIQDECGLTLSNLNVMLIIAATPECRVLDIADALAITVGGTSQAVDRLERSGRCIRRAHPTDRRSSIVELTGDGEEALRRAEPIFDDELTRLISTPLSADGLPGLASALDTLRKSASR
jgi:DNA-binding MarR family transcriptional regulator